MTKKAKIEKVTQFDELKFSLPPVLYDAEKDQTIPITIHMFTAMGLKNGYGAHVLKPMTDERFFSQAAELEQQKKESFNPVRKLWKDLISTRIGYKKNDDFSGVTDDDIIRIFNVSRKFELEVEETEDDEAFDDSGETVLNFRTFYGGISLEDWKGWLSNGELPENVSLDEEGYEAVLSLLKKDIAPAAELLVTFYVPKTSFADNKRFTDISEGLATTKMASASRDKRPKAEQVAELYDDLNIKHEGYASSVPAVHKSLVIQNYFAIKAALLGKS